MESFAPVYLENISTFKLKVKALKNSFAEDINRRFDLRVKRGWKQRICKYMYICVFEN